MHRLAPHKPWRQKPEPWLRYWPGSPDRRVDPRNGVMGIVVYCVAMAADDRPCGHNSKMKVTDLPEGWTWAEISAHMRCTACGAIGYVDLRPDWPTPRMGLNKPL